MCQRFLLRAHFHLMQSYKNKIKSSKQFPFNCMLINFDVIIITIHNSNEGFYLSLLFCRVVPMLSLKKKTTLHYTQNR